MANNENNMYSNSKVYKLFDSEGYYYYGSTCTEIRKRLFQHKKMSKQKANRKV